MVRLEEKEPENTRRAAPLVPTRIQQTLVVSVDPSAYPVNITGNIPSRQCSMQKFNGSVVQCSMQKLNGSRSSMVQGKFNVEVQCRSWRRILASKTYRRRSSMPMYCRCMSMYTVPKVCSSPESPESMQQPRKSRKYAAAPKVVQQYCPEMKQIPKV